MEKLAHNVGGGGNAEDDGAENLLPPGQQQHRILSPTIVTSCPVSLDQTYGTLTFLSVTLAVGEVVAIVYSKKKQKSLSKVQVTLTPTARMHVGCNRVSI